MAIAESVRRHGPRGFALPGVLVIVSALLVLAVGILVVSALERRTARSYVDLQRAGLVTRAGLEEVRAVLDRQTKNDDFIILHGHNSPDDHRVPYLMVVRGPAGDGSPGYRAQPLFSSNDPAERAVDDPARIDISPLLDSGDEACATFPPLRYQDPVRVAWVPIEDAAKRVVGRYAYWVEDLQARLDPAVTGNEKGDNRSHAWNAYPFPAAGVNPEPESDDEPPLDRVPLYAIVPGTSATSQGTLENELIDGRAALLSPDSLLAAAGIDPPLERDASGRLEDSKARAVEENLVANLQPYLERPLIPALPGIDPFRIGKPKMNLNAILARGAAGVVPMADFIDGALPAFAGRRGGFPENYLRTLAANAVDYADRNGDATVSEGSHRGLDAHPLVSEFLMRFRWLNVTRENGRLYVHLSVSTYVELWNMTDQPVRGEAMVTYETKYRFELGPNPNVSLDDLSEATHGLIESGGRWWFPPFFVELEPNQHEVHPCGTVEYKIDAGPASLFVSSPLTLQDEIYGMSGAGYMLRWNGMNVDRSRGGVHRNNSNLHYPRSSGRPNHATRATIPSHSHTRMGEYRNNMGDPRMSYYNAAPQDANLYPDNYSPHRRNLRYGSVYGPDVASKPKVHGRVMPSEWPDGGHNGAYGSNAFFTTEAGTEPDDSRFRTGRPKWLREEAPMRLSNLGRFFSATELGRVYDPVMWEVAMPAAANLPWGDVMPDSRASTDFGGGNTLRIGRPEHPRFALAPGMHAARLLDLFHVGRSRSDDAAMREGPLVEIQGHVNVNTATRGVLRALVSGPLLMDPLIARRTSQNHNTLTLMAPPVKALSDAERELPVERIVDAIIRSRPFVSSSQLAEVRDSSGQVVFGNRALFPKGEDIHWTDSAAEELFARVYDATTVRSRNFRVWVIGQALAPLPAETSPPQVLAEVRKVFTLFADPGERDDDGAIDPSKARTRILYENDF